MAASSCKVRSKGAAAVAVRGSKEAHARQSYYDANPVIPSSLAAADAVDASAFSLPSRLAMVAQIRLNQVYKALGRPRQARVDDARSVKFSRRARASHPNLVWNDDLRHA